MTLNLYEDGVVLCNQGGGLSDDGLCTCHPLS